MNPSTAQPKQQHELEEEPVLRSWARLFPSLEKRLPDMPYCETGESPTSLSGRHCTVWYRCAMLRLEDRIRRLCSELLTKEDDAEVGPILDELRHALHQHIERLRERLGSYPILVERRARNYRPTMNEPDQEDTAKKTPMDVRT